MQTINYTPIGWIHTPFPEPEGVPIQPVGARGIRGTVEIQPELVPGLRDLDGFSHIILLYHLHLSSGYALEVIPFLDDTSHGLFATRAPRRPNPIGLSVVRLVRVEGNLLHIEDVDIVDGTPLLDIKPYFAELDSPQAESTGWLAEVLKRIRADERFGSGRE